MVACPYETVHELVSDIFQTLEAGESVSVDNQKE